MRVLLGVVLILLVLGVIGWVNFDFDSGRSSLNFETEKARQDIDNLSDSVGELGETINEELDEPVDNNATDHDADVEVTIENEDDTNS